MKKSDLKKFAKLIVVQGVNVQKGQPVIIRSTIEAAPLVRYVVEECYKVGAREVSVDWSDDEISRISYTYQATDVLGTVPNWQVEKIKWSVEELPARINIMASDPDALASIDKKKLMAVRQSVGKVLKPYSDQMDNKYQWTIVGYPGVKWAHKVFPDVNRQEFIDDFNSYLTENDDASMEEALMDIIGCSLDEAQTIIVASNGAIY